MASINLSTGVITQNECTFKQILFGTSSMALSNTTGVTVTFSKAFTNIPTVVATATSNSTNTQMRFVGVQNVTTTSFSVYGLYYDFNNTTPIFGGTTFYWIAIGN
jgi:hypothetical protein